LNQAIFRRRIGSTGKNLVMIVSCKKFITVQAERIPATPTNETDPLTVDLFRFVLSGIETATKLVVGENCQWQFGNE
jgi:hypothetical protein